MTPLMRAQGLRYRHPGGFEVGPLDLELGAGVAHLVGPNGSGKTTLLRCLYGALRRSEGRLEVLVVSIGLPQRKV